MNSSLIFCDPHYHWHVACLQTYLLFQYEIRIESAQLNYIKLEIYG